MECRRETTSSRCINYYASNPKKITAHRKAYEVFEWTDPLTTLALLIYSKSVRKTLLSRRLANQQNECLQTEEYQTQNPHCCRKAGSSLDGCKIGNVFGNDCVKKDLQSPCHD